MKIAMLNCLKANDVCTGAGCLRAMNSRTAHFAPYADEPLVLVAMARCSGCDVGIDEGFREKLDRIVSEGVRKDLGRECPVITEAAAYLEQRGVRPVRGTH